MAENIKTSPFNAPIPGQSWTMPPGAAPYEQPPRFTDPHEAMEFLEDKFTDTRHAYRLKKLLEAGMPAEALARTAIFKGTSEGKWTLDVGMLIARPLLYLIVGLGEKLGVKNLRIFNPDREQMEFMDFLDEAGPREGVDEELIDEEQEEMEESGEIEKIDLFKGGLNDGS